MTCFMAGWWLGAKRKTIPVSWTIFAWASGGIPMVTPSAASTSADPHRLLTPRLPCLTTGTPAPAATNAAAVLMLKVCAPSPPVPQVSTSVPATCGLTRTACARITRANAAISSGVSPFIRSPARNPPICACVACPVMISSITASASAGARSRFSTTVAIASFMVMPPPSAVRTGNFS